MTKIIISPTKQEQSNKGNTEQDSKDEAKTHGIIM